MKTPCFVLTDSHDPTILKGSGRSDGFLHLKDILDTCKNILFKYGGHEAAAGISVKKDRFEELSQGLQENVTEYPDSEEDDVTYYDLEIDASQIPDYIEELKRFAPFGQGNPKVVFKVNNFDLFPRYSGCFNTMGNKAQHLKLFGKNMDAVAFDKVAVYTEMNEPKSLNFIGILSENYFKRQGTKTYTITPQVEVIDMMDSLKPEVKSDMAMLLEKKAKERYA